MGDIDVDLNPEEGVVAREECPLLEWKKLEPGLWGI
jgi:hypothetical protein